MDVERKEVSVSIGWDHLCTLEGANEVGGQKRRRPLGGSMEHIFGPNKDVMNTTTEHRDSVSSESPAGMETFSLYSRPKPASPARRAHYGTGD